MEQNNTYALETKKQYVPLNNETELILTEAFPSSTCGRRCKEQEQEDFTLLFPLPADLVALSLLLVLRSLSQVSNGQNSLMNATNNSTKRHQVSLRVGLKSKEGLIHEFKAALGMSRNKLMNVDQNQYIPLDNGDKEEIRGRGISAHHRPICTYLPAPERLYRSATGAYNPPVESTRPASSMDLSQLPDPQSQSTPTQNSQDEAAKKAQEEQMRRDMMATVLDSGARERCTYRIVSFLLLYLLFGTFVFPL